MATRSDVTRTAMLDAAERIAVERGIGAATVTEVQARAGQSNKSAARYHFGSRDGLLDAVLERRMAPVDAARQDLLRACTGMALEHREVAALFVRPLALHTLRRPGSVYARFLMQALSDPVESTRVLNHPRNASFRELEQRFLGDTSLPPPFAELRFGSMVILAVGSLATWEGHLAQSNSDVDVIVEDLIRTAAAVLDTPHQP